MKTNPKSLSGNSSGDNGFRNSALEVKAELLIAALEYLQV